MRIYFTFFFEIYIHKGILANEVFECNDRVKIYSRFLSCCQLCGALLGLCVNLTRTSGIDYQAEWLIFDEFYLSYKTRNDIWSHSFEDINVSKLLTIVRDVCQFVLPVSNFQVQT